MRNRLDDLRPAVEVSRLATAASAENMTCIEGAGAQQSAGSAACLCFFSLDGGATIEVRTGLEREGGAEPAPSLVMGLMVPAC